MRSRPEVEQLLEAVRAVLQADLRCPGCGTRVEASLDNDLLSLEATLCWVLRVPRPTQDEPDDTSPLTYAMDPRVQALVAEACGEHPAVAEALAAGREAL